MKQRPDPYLVARGPSVDGTSIAGLAGILALAAFTPAAAAQVVIKDLQFDVDGVLPSADPEIQWYDDGVSAVFPEATFMSVAGGVLQQRSLGVAGTYPVYGYPNCPALKGPPNLMDPDLSTTLEFRVKALALSGSHGAQAEFYTGEHYYALALDTLGIWTLDETMSMVHAPLDVFTYHDYRLEADGGSNTFRIYVDGALVISSKAPALTSHQGFTWGDDSSLASESGDADWDYIRVTQSPPPVSIYCTAGTSANGCQASLAAAGTASATAASGFTLTATGVEGQKNGIYLFGTNGRQAIPWGNGTSFQCVVPPVARAEALFGNGTPGLCDGSLSQDMNALWCSTCPKSTKNPGASATVQAQLWYRDPLSTSNQTTSLSNAIEFWVGP